MNARVSDFAGMAVSIVQAWYAAESGGRGIANAGLIMAHHFAVDYPLDEGRFLTPGRGQISLLGGDRIKKIVEAFDPNLRSASEGGRTNRGNIGAGIDLAERLNDRELFSELTQAERREVANEMQRWLVTVALRELANKERIKPDYDLTATLLVNVRAILEAAEHRKILGCVAQHLVGAKLQLRFPSIKIDRHGCSAADVPTGRKGDFAIDDSVFHVTVAPASRLVGKCADNIKDGLRPFVVVPSDKAAAITALLEEAGIVRVVTVYPLDTFLAQNLDEMSEYSPRNAKTRLLALISEYNARVDEAEVDKFLMLKAPGRR